MKIWLAILGSYFGLWIFFYVLTMGTDFRFALEYFIKGWWHGGEVPVVLNLYSLAGTAVVTSVLVAWNVFKNRKKKIEN